MQGKWKKKQQNREQREVNLKRQILFSEIHVSDTFYSLTLMESEKKKQQNREQREVNLKRQILFSEIHVSDTFYSLTLMFKN